MRRVTGGHGLDPFQGCALNGSVRKTSALVTVAWIDRSLDTAHFGVANRVHGKVTVLVRPLLQTAKVSLA